MRSRLAVLSLCVYLALAVIGCNKPPSDNATNAATDSQTATGNDQNAPALKRTAQGSR